MSRRFNDCGLQGLAPALLPMLAAAAVQVPIKDMVITLVGILL
jgi:hypothetical protein